MSGDWTVPRRTHPWSVVVNAVHEARRIISALLIAMLSGRALGGGQLVEVLVPVGVAVLGVLGWARTSFRVAPEEFRLDSGVIFRRSRTARFDRIQAVDVDQPIVARLFGLAELRIQLGGGRQGHFRLACVRQQEAAQLRAYLLARCEQARSERADEQVRVEHPNSGHPGPGHAYPEHLDAEYTGDGEHVNAGPATVASALLRRDGNHPIGAAAGAGSPSLADGASESQHRPLVVIPGGRFLGSLALSAPSWIAALAVAASLAAWAAGVARLLGGFAPEVIAAVALAWDRFQRYYNFTLSLGDDGIRLRHGLLNRFVQTVPLSRLQAVEISQPLLWRANGWARIRMNVAGYARGGGRGESGRRNTAILLPVAPVLTAFQIAGQLLGADLSAIRLESAPERARWRAALWHRGYMYGFDDVVVVARTGLLRRRYCVIPHAKVQSLHMVQGPWQRRLSLASVALHSTRGPVKIVLRHRDVADAQRFLEEQSHRSANARRGATVSA